MKSNNETCICTRCPLYSEENRKKGKTYLCGDKKTECTMDSHDECICFDCALYKGSKFSGCNFCSNKK